MAIKPFPRSAGIYRPSRSLHLRNKLEGPAMRRPFLRHVAEDEDFLAAYLGYDNINDLHRLQFSEGTFSNFFLPPTCAEPHEEYMVLKLILELTAIDRSRPQPPCHDGMYELQILLDDAESPCASFPALASDLGGYLHETAVYAPRHFYAQGSEDEPLKPQTKDEFTKIYMPYRHGKKVTFDFPALGPMVKPPIFNNSGNPYKPDIESCLRIAALMHSTKEVTILSIWRRKWPWTVKEKTQEQLRAEGLEQFEKMLRGPSQDDAYREFKDNHDGMSVISENGLLDCETDLGCHYYAWDAEIEQEERRRRYSG